MTTSSVTPHKYIIRERREACPSRVDVQIVTSSGRHLSFREFGTREAALAFSQVNHMTLRVAEHLHFDMTRLA